MTASSEQENNNKEAPPPKIDWEKVKQKLQQAAQQANIQFDYLRHCLSRFGAAGFGWWLKSRHQLEQREAALQALAERALQEDFRLDEVEAVFSQFILPEEDVEQATWYKRAHDLLQQFEQRLCEEQRFDKRQLDAALKELRFIMEADEFHQRYSLSELQQRVAEMYQTLQKELLEFKQLEKDKLAASKEAEKTEQLKLEKAKAEAEAKKAMAQNIAIKEKRLAIAEEKKRRIAEKEATEAKRIQQEEEAEIEAKKAEAERQRKLQDSYVELQIEERIKSMTAETLLNLALQQLEKSDDLSFMQGDLLRRIEQLIAKKNN